MTNATKNPDTGSSHPVVLRRVVGLFVALVAAWLLWSWLFKPLVLGLGVMSCLLVIYLVYRMDYFRSEYYALRFGPRLLTYWAWLTKEVFASSIAVVRVILSPGLPISPRTIEIDTGMSDPIDQTIYANSITLTPGTLALDVHEGKIKVHSLTHGTAEALTSGDMGQRIEQLRR